MGNYLCTIRFCVSFLKKTGNNQIGFTCTKIKTKFTYAQNSLGSIRRRRKIKYFIWDLKAQIHFVNFSSRHSNVFCVLKKWSFSLKDLNFRVFKICKKVMKSFFIFLKNSLNNNLHLIEHQDKRKTFLCQLCSLKVYLIWWTPLCNTYYHRFHFLIKFASHYDRDESEMKHGCCKQILFLNE